MEERKSREKFGMCTNRQVRTHYTRTQHTIRQRRVTQCCNIQLWLDVKPHHDINPRSMWECRWNADEYFYVKKASLSISNDRHEYWTIRRAQSSCVRDFRVIGWWFHMPELSSSCLSLPVSIARYFFASHYLLLPILCQCPLFDNVVARNEQFKCWNAGSIQSSSSLAVAKERKNKKNAPQQKTKESNVHLDNRPVQISYIRVFQNQYN